MRAARRFDIAFFAAALALLSFSLPGREGPESAGGVDFLALSKLGIRVVAIVYFAMACWITWSTSSIRSSELIHRYRISWLLLPWFFFAGWSLLSVSWSALPVVSVGQWLGLVALLMFTQTVAWRYRESVAWFQKQSQTLANYRPDSNRFRWVDLIVWVHFILFIYCLGVLIVHLAAPQISGLDRALWISGNNGLVHPTAAGASSSLGVLIGVFLLARKLTRTRTLMITMVLVELAVLYFSKSRSALLMTVVCLSVYAVVLTSDRIRGTALLAIGAALLVWISLDPGFEIAGDGLDLVTAYVSRGQTADELKNVSGRSEMWAAIWEQYQTSPILGHGYFVTSSNGKLDVWQGPANQDAHNILLQVLVTTGVIGMIPFAWAMVRMVRAGINETDADWFWLMTLTGIWFVGWSQGCVTFLGPIRPESVVFFAVLGVAAGRVDVRISHIDEQQEFQTAS
jgi:O-antigen ligase